MYAERSRMVHPPWRMGVPVRIGSLAMFTTASCAYTAVGGAVVVVAANEDSLVTIWCKTGRNICKAVLELRITE
eukprot:2592050-Prymnesium_polylepis.1